MSAGSILHIFLTDFVVLYMYTTLEKIIGHFINDLLRIYKRVLVSYLAALNGTTAWQTF